MDRETFLDDSIQTLRREVPEDLEWLFCEGPPPLLRWRGDLAPVDPRLAKGWLVMAAKRGLLDPSVTQHRQADLLDVEDREQLAIWLMRMWSAHCPSCAPEVDEARRRELRAMAEKASDVARQFGRDGTDSEARYRQLVEQEAHRVNPSALDHQGLLALVVVCAADPSSRDRLRSEMETLLTEGDPHSDRTDGIHRVLLAMDS